MGDSTAAITEDTDCLESWEDLQESGELDKKLEKIQISKVQQLQNGISSSQSRVSSVIIVPEDVRSRFMAQEPSVKILRRPTNGCDNLHVNDAKPKQPIKTLQQREIEYAKARLRILGSARSPEENLEDATVALEERIQKIQPKPQILRPPSTCDSPTRLQQLSPSSSQIGIIRVPRGPDGSPGFNFRR